MKIGLVIDGDWSLSVGAGSPPGTGGWQLIVLPS